MKLIKTGWYILIIVFFFIIKDYEYNQLLFLSKNPKISIFLPIYNKEKFLIRSIKSIQIQTLKDLEIIAINDGSTDKSLKVLRKLSKKDIRIKIINNDRNHGLLYSRAMGIKNSNGEYVMNLDPDDKLDDNDNLELLYYKAKISNSDLVIFLLKRIPLNKLEEEEYNYLNKMQLTTDDVLITNKFINRKLILKVYNILKKKIYKNKWNYHEDNIWNILIRKYSNSSSILNKFIYIYKRNNESLMLNNDNINDVKNRVYRIKTIQEINSNYDINEFKKYYNNAIKYFNNSIKINNEIRNILFHVSANFLSQYYYNETIYREINYAVNKISHNKIIILNKFYSGNIINYLIHICIFKFLQNNFNKKIISINLDNKTQVNDTINYIYPNDLIIGIDEIFFDGEYIIPSNLYLTNKIIIFTQKINETIINKNTFLLNNYNYKIFILNETSFEMVKQIKRINHLYYLPDFITNLANLFNRERNKLKENILIILNNNKTNIFNQIFKKILYKYFSEVNFYNRSLNINNTSNLIKLISEYNIILTDNIYIMNLSAISFISCIIYNNTNKYKLINNLDYIKYVNDINELEKTIIALKNSSNSFNQEKYFQYYSLIKNELFY